MKYVVVVKHVTEEMLEEECLLGCGLSEGAKCGNAFIVADSDTLYSTDKGRSPSYDMKPTPDPTWFFLPHKWCIEITKAEYDVFKQLEKKEGKK